MPFVLYYILHIGHYDVFSDSASLGCIYPSAITARVHSNIDIDIDIYIPLRYP